uniref:uncharacterized protein LOC122780340 n=1 Tax=Solea senegalensis TaxID=28829 RepID=UPI001CD84089|nr:uncharacterized protein LOC122780340 [Solea senegalensis]
MPPSSLMNGVPIGTSFTGMDIYSLRCATNRTLQIKTVVLIHNRRRTRPTTKTVKIWPEDALSKLQDCFNMTDWDLFEHKELEKHTQTVLDYSQFCMGNVTVDKAIRVFPNQKFWMTNQVRTLLMALNAAFRSGDRALYSAARADLKRGIKRVKADHRLCIQSHLSSNNTREVWQGIQDITNYRGCEAPTADRSAILAEEFNSFFARFETSQQLSSAHARPQSPPASCTTPLTVQEHNIRWVLLAVNIKKAAGPDGVPGRVLKACANELAPTFTKIFNLSLAQAIIPSCLKTSI